MHLYVTAEVYTLVHLLSNQKDELGSCKSADVIDVTVEKY